MAPLESEQDAKEIPVGPVKSLRQGKACGDYNKKGKKT